jgi:CRP-like cAMP-binding protein
MPRVRTGNRLLDACSDDEFAALSSKLVPLALELDDVVRVPGEPYAHAYFPVNCVLSSTIVMNDGNEVEIATVGSEGFDPMALLIGGERSAHRTVCQISGDAYRLPRETFEDAVERFPGLRDRARRFAKGFLDFMGQSIACNRLHPLLERCARWLLMAHDRVEGDLLSLTQEYLAVMLGVRRPAVNVAARTLAAAGLITYRRGAITILDREGLEAAACECYATVRAGYERTHQ